MKSQNHLDDWLSACYTKNKKNCWIIDGKLRWQFSYMVQLFTMNVLCGSHESSMLACWIYGYRTG